MYAWISTVLLTNQHYAARASGGDPACPVAVWADVLGFVAVCHSSAAMTKRMEFFIKYTTE